uniref:Uncharacterized protein n=1 Tax=Anguilla anguilla TaxID=7936 RepID=A0A0E9SLQ9_ANGAN
MSVCVVAVISVGKPEKCKALCCIGMGHAQPRRNLAEWHICHPNHDASFTLKSGHVSKLKVNSPNQK